FFLPLIPQLLVWIAAMILAFIFWSRYPRVCLLTFIATLILFLQAVFGTLFIYLLPRMVAPGQEIAIYFSVLGIGRLVLVTAAWIVILLAIFGWRKARPAFVTIADPMPPSHPARDLPRKDYPPSAIRE